MTNIGHFRAAGKLLEKTAEQLPTRLWVAPPTKMDAAQLTAEGYYGIFGKVGARLEMPGCSLCMGNQVLYLNTHTHIHTPPAQSINLVVSACGHSTRGPVLPVNRLFEVRDERRQSCQ